MAKSEPCALLSQSRVQLQSPALVWRAIEIRRRMPRSGGPREICFSDPKMQKSEASLATWHIPSKTSHRQTSLTDPLQAQPFHLLYNSCCVTIDHRGSDLSCLTRIQNPSTRVAFSPLVYLLPSLPSNLRARLESTWPISTITSLGPKVPTVAHSILTPAAVHLK
jgi:hypothetical protein